MNEEEYKATDLGKIAPALVAFQAAVSSVEKTALNPHLNKDYADFADYVKVARPILAENGLCVVQRTFPNEAPNSMLLVTTIIHNSGQWISDGGFLVTWGTGNRGVNINQAQGAAMSYAKRYTYAAILGLVVKGEDDDGINASPQQNQLTPPPQSPTPVQAGYGGQAPQEPAWQPPQDQGPPQGWNDAPQEPQQPQAPAPAPVGNISPELAGWATTLRTQLRHAPHEGAIEQTFNNPQNQARLEEVKAASATGYNHLVEEYQSALARARNASGAA